MEDNEEVLDISKIVGVDILRWNDISSLYTTDLQLSEESPSPTKPTGISLSVIYDAMMEAFWLYRTDEPNKLSFLPKDTVNYIEFKTTKG